MKWFVYRHEFNSKKIEKFNIFDHCRFTEAVKKLKKMKLAKDEFAEKLRSELMYYFWSKCEYEVIITSFPPYIDSDELCRLNEENELFVKVCGRNRVRVDVDLLTADKIDIYDQVMMNWDAFVSYVFESKG